MLSRGPESFAPSGEEPTTGAPRKVREWATTRVRGPWIQWLGSCGSPWPLPLRATPRAPLSGLGVGVMTPRRGPQPAPAI